MKEMFTVNVPSDYSTDPKERARVAFIAAEEQAETYKVPCTWNIESDNGEDMVVSRES